MGQGLAEKAVVGEKIRLTSICSRIATARYLRYSLPVKLCLVEVNLAGPQSAEMPALGVCLGLKKAAGFISWMVEATEKSSCHRERLRFWKKR